MNDRPLDIDPSVAPVVDFSRPYNPMSELVLQRERLREVKQDIAGMIRNIGRYEAEAIMNANIAAAWAVTLTVCDVLKFVLSVADRRAAVVFAARERQIATANRVLKVLGAPQLPTHSDILKAVGEDLRTPQLLVDQVKKGRDALGKLKAPTTGAPIPVKLSNRTNLLIDLGINLAEDSIAVMYTRHLQQQATATANTARAGMLANFQRLNQKLLLIDQEITHVFEQAEILSRTA